MRSQATRSAYPIEPPALVVPFGEMTSGGGVVPLTIACECLFAGEVPRDLFVSAVDLVVLGIHFPWSLVNLIPSCTLL